jgi:hypothetical protein
MVSKFANRKKQILSRHRLRAGAEAAQADPADGSNAPAADGSQTVMKESDRLRQAAKDALEELKKYGSDKPFVINLEKNADGSDNELEDTFYKRCTNSQKLVKGMQENLEKERVANLQKLLEAEKKLQEQKKSALKSQAALNFLTKKNETFNQFEKDLADLKLKISQLVTDANDLNDKCTTELGNTVNADVRLEITKQLEAITEQDKTITDRLEELLSSISEKPAETPAASDPAAAAPAAAAPAAGGGRYRRSRNNNLGKRRSFRLKGGNTCAGYWVEDDCNEDNACWWQNGCVELNPSNDDDD